MDKPIEIIDKRDDIDKFILKNGLTIDDIRFSLINLPTKIKERELNLFKQKKEIEELDLLIMVSKYAMLSEVEAEEKDGKKIYSNEKKREIEVRRRLKDDKLHQENILKLNKLIEEIQNEEISISYLGRLFRAAESIAFLERY